MLELARQRRLIQRKKARDSEAKTDARVPEGGGAALDEPLRARMESGMGADLSSVKLHTGADSAKAAEGYGARAFTVGNDVHFGRGEYAPGSREGDRLIAHELAHVVQGQRAGVQRKAHGADARDEVSQPGDPAEREADEIADAVVDGKKAPAAGRASAPISRDPLPGAAQNPQELNDASTGKNTTKTTEATPNQGYGGPAEADNSGAPAKCEPMSVNIVHGENNPLRLDGVPNPAELYLRAPDGAGTQVDEEIGTVESPYVKEQADPEQIFIGGGPVDQDIEQHEIGDCYFLAALHQIVSRDPGKIKSMMKVTGNTVTTNFFRFDASSQKYIDTPITTDRALAHDVYSDDGEANNWIHGAGFRAADKPDRSEWYAVVKGNKLGVVRRDIYETAMWASLLEKAYARFSEQFGQYGGAPAAGSQGVTPNAQTDASGKQNSGYQIIDGGFENLVYNMFYGSAVAEQDEVGMNFDPSKNVVSDNLVAMKRLLQMQGQGLGQNQQLMVTASADDSMMIDRLPPLVQIALSAPEAEHWPEALKGSLKYLGELIQHWHAVSGDQTEEPKSKDKLLKAAREIAAPKSWPMLHRKNTPESLKNLLEVLVDVGDIDVGDDKGQRMVETEHAYSITGLVLKNAKGEDVQVDPATLAQKAGDIDAHKSQVTIRNPHRTDEPSVHGGNKPEDGKDDGNFTVDLEEFFRNFSTLDFAVIQH